MNFYLERSINKFPHKDSRYKSKNDALKRFADDVEFLTLKSLKYTTYGIFRGQFRRKMSKIFNLVGKSKFQRRRKETFKRARKIFLTN